MNQITTNLVGISIEKIIANKNRGVAYVATSESLIENEETITSEKATNVFVKPLGDKFIVLVKPNIEFKKNQPVIIMSKIVLKSLKPVVEVFQPASIQESFPRNTPRVSEDFQRKYPSSSSSGYKKQY